ncbi:MAG TPA: hypothetical protein PLG90_05180 [Ignavibacteria bacterium]|nr:hypothetical protein [Ignavibacteria bacterium]
MKNNILNIFVVETRFQINSIKDFLNSLDGYNLLVISDSTYLDEKNIMDEVITFKPFEYSLMKVIPHFSSVKKTLNAIYKKCLSYETVNIFFAHELSIIANNLVNYLQKYYPSKKIILNLIPDGTTSFSKDPVIGKLKLSVNTKKYLSMLFGIKFKVPKDFIFNQERIDKVHNYYTYVPELSRNVFDIKGKVIKINKSHNLNFTPDDSTCLILGQLLDDLIGVSEMKKFSEKFSEYILKQNYNIIYYKKHRVKSLMDDVAKNNGFEFVNNNLSVEELIESGVIKSKNIYSFCSSALFNIKLFYGDKFNCYAYGLEILKKRDMLSMSQVENAYKIVGVKII